MIRSRRMLAPLVAIVLTLVLAGCGSESSSDGGSGSSGGGGSAASLFKETCGSCHALDAADADGSIDLDGRKLSESRVREQIKDGGSGMPSGLLDGKDADEVAKFVADATSE